MKNKRSEFYLRLLSFVERLIHNNFTKIRIKIHKTDEKTDKANNPESWEKMYLTKVKPITGVRSEISQRIIDLTKEEDTLLETGCGSGLLSAELAFSGRDVAVFDFSELILNRVKELFKLSNLPEPKTYLADMTKMLPFSDNQFDVIWNSGVLEHWTDDELKPILQEFVRCSKKCVISFVPNERSILYRYGRENAEKNGIAPWGREIPRSSLKSQFEIAGLKKVFEETLGISMAVNFLNYLDPAFSVEIGNWLNLLPESDPVKENQGYLLLTVGYK